MLTALKRLWSGQNPPKGLSPQMDAYNSQRKTKNLSAVCYAPSTNMYFSQDGNVKLCCHNMDYAIGRYPDQSISEIWTSEAAKKIRQDMRDYLLPAACSVCGSDIDRGAHEEVSAGHFDTLPVHDSYPTMMEFLLSNTCNLECVMCQGEFSSLIRKNREKLPAITSPYDSAFIEQLRPYIRHLKEARFSGSGEAFAIDIYYELWDMLITENPTCKIMVQTNGTIMNARVKDLLERGNFQIGVSLDSLQKDVFEAIRLNASFDRVMENIRYFSDYSKRRGNIFLLAMCVMRDNALEMPAFTDFCTSIGAHVKFHQVHSPEHFSLATLSAEKLKPIYQTLISAELKAEGKLCARNARHYRYFTGVIGEWLQQAEQHAADQQSFLTIPEYESKMADAVASVSDVFTKDDVADFQRKLELILNSYTEDGQRKILYHRALMIDIKIVIGAMLKYPDEYLISQAGNLFKI